MLYSPTGLRRRSRRGAAVAEFAVLLPVLAFLFMVATDYARIFYYAVIINNCARSGALYGRAGPTYATDTVGIQNAALADAAAQDVSPTPNVASTTGTDSAGNPFVQVTVTYQFQTVVNYPGIPTSTTLTRMVQMRVDPP
jgi:Flp pilus assembly protein TadG